MQHTISGNTPNGKSYQGFLSGFAGALALCDTYAVPKYSEVPLAGCVCFAQYQHDYEKMGFRDGESCIYVTKKNFHREIEGFKEDVAAYQPIATRGRELILNNWTAKHFAEAVHAIQ
jgi:hypothetical protein